VFFLYKTLHSARKALLIELRTLAYLQSSLDGEAAAALHNSMHIPNCPVHKTPPKLKEFLKLFHEKYYLGPSGGRDSLGVPEGRWKCRNASACCVSTLRQLEQRGW
jgi:hypothetical protein